MQSWPTVTRLRMSQHGRRRTNFSSSCATRFIAHTQRPQMSYLKTSTIRTIGKPNTNSKVASKLWHAALNERLAKLGAPRDIHLYRQARLYYIEIAVETPDQKAIIPTNCYAPPNCTALHLFYPCCGPRIKRWSLGGVVFVEVGCIVPLAAGKGYAQEAPRSI
jgi:hypothetical protein